MTRSRRLIGLAVGAAAIALMANGVVFADATAQTFTGCLKGGQITRVTLGSSPARPCPRGFVQISWSRAGPQGDTGATGATGAQGATGPVGPTGAQGTQGPEGVPGVGGAGGAIGPQGLQGPVGPQGATGPAGPKGDPGAGITSLESLNGIACSSGAGIVRTSIGLDGAISLSCLIGATGPTGDTGPTGYTGATGPTGATGAIGPTGETYTAVFRPTSVIKRVSAPGGGYSATIKLDVSAAQGSPITVSFDGSTDSSFVVVNNADGSGNLTIPAGQTSIDVQVSAAGIVGDSGTLIAQFPNGQTATFVVAFACLIGTVCLLP